MAHRALQLLANEPAKRLNRGAGSGVAAEGRRNDSGRYSPLWWAGGSASPLSATDAERFRRGATDGRRIAMASVSVSIGVAVLTFGVGLHVRRLARHDWCGNRAPQLAARLGARHAGRLGLWRARVWLLRSGERDLFDPRAQPTVHWALPDSL